MSDKHVNRGSEIDLIQATDLLAQESLLVLDSTGLARVRVAFDRVSTTLAALETRSESVAA